MFPGIILAINKNDFRTTKDIDISNLNDYEYVIYEKILPEKLFIRRDKNDYIKLISNEGKIYIDDLMKKTYQKINEKIKQMKEYNIKKYYIPATEIVKKVNEHITTDWTDTINNYSFMIYVGSYKYENSLYIGVGGIYENDKLIIWFSNGPGQSFVIEKNNETIEVTSNNTDSNFNDQHIFDKLKYIIKYILSAYVTNKLTIDQKNIFIDKINELLPHLNMQHI